MIEIDGVQFFGDPAGEVTLEEIWTLQMPPEAMLHVTRHLAALSPAARERLCSYTNASFVDAQLRTLGSKFHVTIADPEAIMTFAARRLTEAVTEAPIAWVRQRDRFVAMARVRTTAEQRAELGLAAEEPLGYASVVPITEENAHLVTQRPRGEGEDDDHLMVNAIALPAAPCNDLVIAVRKDTSDGSVIFVSTYVGIIAPSLPRKQRQSPEEFARNAEWWSLHAFTQ